MVVMEAGSVLPNGHAIVSQTVQSTHPWTGALSGGVWARLNNVENNYSILDAAQAQARFRSVPSSLPPVQDPPSLFTNNYRVTGNSNLFPLEDEPSIAVSSVTGQLLMVVGANSLSTGLMVSYVSTDQGTTWAGPAYLPLSRNNDSFASDPALGVDRTGKFYYSFLSLASPSASASPTSDDVVVATSPDGVQWTNHVAVQRKTFTGNTTIRGELYDKDYLAVGPNKTNPFFDVIYATYTDFIDYCASGSLLACNEKVNSTIMEVHSTDSGLHWSSPPVAVSPTATASASAMAPPLVTGSMPAVAPAGAPDTGDFYVAYYDSRLNGFLNSSARVMIAKSTNNGLSFSPPTQAAMIPQQLTYASEAGFRWWSSMFPSMDVAPDGTVYIAYGARQPSNSADPADVYLVASTTGGALWDQPVRINDAASQGGAFYAWLKVSSDGILHIIWGDERLDPVGLGYDIFYATATNFGQTISASSRVTDAGTDPLNTIGFIGDYFNLAVSGNQVYPVWTDGRRGIRTDGRYILTGETDIYTARLGPRDTPSITLGSSVPAGYLAPVTITGSGLPRETYFIVRMSGIPVVSQGNGIVLFFSTKSGTLSDIISPDTNYNGSYTVELDEWLSGAQLATTTLTIPNNNNGSSQGLTDLANSEQTYIIIIGIIAAAAVALQVLHMIRRKTTPPSLSPTPTESPASPPTGPPNPPPTNSPSLPPST